MTRTLQLALLIAGIFPSVGFSSESALDFQADNINQATCYPVANASFESTLNKRPENWSTSSWGGSRANYEIAEPGVNSTYSAKIEMQVFVPNTDAKLRSDDISVFGNKPINISFFARGEAMSVDLQVVQFDLNHQVIDYTWLDSVDLDEDENQWKEQSSLFYSTDQTTYIQIEFLLKSEGVIYVDDVWVGEHERSVTCTNSSSENTLISSDLTNGLIFSRSDKQEYRWVAEHPTGGIGSIWISEYCANQFDTSVIHGDWKELQELAPRLDSLESPCASVPSNSSTISLSSTGYVFSRTDKQEHRWIDLEQTGVYGSRWISDSCAQRLGGAVAFGDWTQLLDLAPAFDQILAPC